MILKKELRATALLFVASSFLWCGVLFPVVVVDADFGNYVDPTFQCPAKTTCPQLCVASIMECPQEMRCNPLLNETLCADGSCSTTECDPELESPCEAECVPVACNRVDNDYESCFNLYGDLYDFATTCAEEEAEESTTLLSWKGPVFLFVYVWVGGVTFLILLWCLYNQKVSPVSDSRAILHFDQNAAQAAAPSNAHDEQPDDAAKATAICWQTGYRVHPLGLFIQFLAMLTFAGWVVLLAWLTIQYYALDGNEYVSRRTVHFEDEEQLLKCFIISWSVGIVWCFAMKWPFDMSLLFMRRCSLSQASYVTVFLDHLATAEEKEAHSATSDLLFSKSSPFVRFLSHSLQIFMNCTTSVMGVIFSDPDCFHCRSGVYRICSVKHNNGVIKAENKYFVFLFRRYNFSTTSQSFSPGYIDVGTTLGGIAQATPMTQGLSEKQVDARFKVAGLNKIEMSRPTILGCIGKELVKPFYTYQLFMIFSWMPLYYYYMALGWTFVVLTSALTVGYFDYVTNSTLYRLTHTEGEARVIRDGQLRTVSHEDLMPGDIVQVTPGITFCDMVLLQTGDSAVVVDESALTGESNPQAKAPVDVVEEAAVMYDPMVAHKRHTINAGTTIVQADQKALAVVFHTGSYTIKGEMLREIFSYQRHKFKFDTEVYVVIAILVIYAVIGFNLVNAFIVDTAVYSWFYGIYVVGTTLPPLLPTVFTVSVFISDYRLRKQRVATVNAESILIAGKVSRAFFDKTGTLTKQGLDFLSSIQSTKLSESMSGFLSIAMATCHSLTLSDSGSLLGNPVDRTMFISSGATLHSTKGNSTSVTDSSGKTLEVVRRFDFDHHRMTQSVIVKLADGNYAAICKGSGESIQKLCVGSSLPEDFETSLQETARDGVYQISFAAKRLESNASVGSMTRDEVERDLEFVGFLDFKNVLREETKDVIQQLSDGQVQSIMVTGDSVLTGVSVAIESGIFSEGKTILIGNVDESGSLLWTDNSGELSKLPSLEILNEGMHELALSGKAWNLLSDETPDLAASLIQFIKVFGRCTPQDKVSVVGAFVAQGFVTLMCGDGGNDAGALKVAHVGIALSDAEASIVAPFTSLDKDIRSVLDVLKEGRCALASAISSYKYIIMYGQVETINQMINAYFQITFTEWCWVFMDGFWTITLSMSLPLARPAKSLSKTRPTASILGPETMASVLGVLIINFIFMALGFVALFNQDWYQCRKWDSTDVSNVLVIGDNYESQVLFLVTGYQYISAAIVYNFGYEFRQAWCFNYVLILFIAFYTAMHFYITLVPSKLSCLWRVNCENEDVVVGVTAHDKFPIQNPFNTTVMPYDFRVIILVIMITNTVAICLYDYLIVNGIRKHFAAKRISSSTSVKEVKVESTKEAFSNEAIYMKEEAEA